MGRKSSKAKEKKQKRLEERAAMDAVCAKVDAANRLGDPLEAFPVFKKYDRNGLNVSIECKRVSGLEPATVDWAFDLTKTNMQTMYEQSEWGWKDREKREEMTDDRAWYLIAWENSAVPVAFSHFRFDVECGHEVLYCYEVQLESKVRRKGLGKFLIQILQLMANSTQMKKVMLTVFKHNHGAYQFFREALQFEIDDSSPSMSGCCGEDCSYEILSRRTKFGDGQHSHAGLDKWSVCAHLCGSPGALGQGVAGPQRNGLGARSGHREASESLGPRGQSAVTETVGSSSVLRCRQARELSPAVLLWVHSSEWDRSRGPADSGKKAASLPPSLSVREA